MKEAVFWRKKLVVKKRVVNVVIGRVKRGRSDGSSGGCSSSSSSICHGLCVEEVVVNVMILVVVTRVMHVKEEILREV